MRLKDNNTSTVNNSAKEQNNNVMRLRHKVNRLYKLGLMRSTNGLLFYILKYNKVNIGG